MTREVASRTITVFPVTRVKNTVRGFRMRYEGDGFVESLQVFDTRGEAEAANQHEKLAADYAVRDPKELLAILQTSVEAMQTAGFPLVHVCRYAQLPYDSIRAYLNGYNPPNPRTVARVKLTCGLLLDFCNRARSILPEGSGCGNPLMHRDYHKKWSEYAEGVDRAASE